MLWPRDEPHRGRLFHDPARPAVQHTDFVDGYRRGTIQIDVDRSKAMRIANAADELPAEFRSSHRLWSAAWLLAIPVAFAAAFLHSWWAGALILFVVMPALYTATKRSAAQHVIAYAVKSSAFYSYAVENGVIRIRQKG